MSLGNFLLQLINFYSERCQLEDALLVAQAASEGLFKSTITEDSLKVNNVSLKRSNVLPTVNKFQAEGPRYVSITNVKKFAKVLITFNLFSIIRYVFC